MEWAAGRFSPPASGWKCRRHQLKSKLYILFGAGGEVESDIKDGK
jgi:hypothetical protein